MAAIRAYARFLKRLELLWGVSILAELKSSTINSIQHSAFYFHRSLPFAGCCAGPTAGFD